MLHLQFRVENNVLTKSFPESLVASAPVAVKLPSKVSDVQLHR